MRIPRPRLPAVVLLCAVQLCVCALAPRLAAQVEPLRTDSAHSGSANARSANARSANARSEYTQGANADSARRIVHVLFDSTRNAMHLTATTNDAGGWFCAWTERTAHGAGIKGIFFSRGQTDGFSPVAISADALPHDADCEDAFASATFLTDSTVLVAWQRGCRTSRTVWACVFARSGVRGNAVSVSDSDAGAMMPVAARNDAGEVLVAWQDYRNGNADVYARRFDRDGNIVGPGMRINDDSGGAVQGAPRIAADNHVGFLLLWPDSRDDGMWKFYYHRFGETSARNVLIDSAQRKAMTTLIGGAITPGDSAMFAWKDYRAGNSNIFRRRADLRSGMFSPAERINDDTEDRWQRLACVDGDRHGQTVVCWEDYRNTEINQRGDIYLQVFARDGAPVDGNQRINDREDRIARKMPTVVMDNDGWYLVLWHQGEEGAFHLMGQWMRYPSQREGGNFCLTCDQRTGR